MLEDGLRYPTRGDWVKHILIGGLLAMFSFLLIPVFFMYGYLLRVLDESYDGRSEPPAFDDWGDLLVKGLVMWLIGLAYAIPILLLSVVLLPVIGFGALQDDPWVIVAGVGLLWFVGTVALSLFIAYLLPAVYVRYARSGRAGSAFEFGEITATAFTRAYFEGIVLSVVVLILFGFVSGLLSLTVIGLVAVPFVGFYAYMATAHIMGHAVRNAHRG